MGNLLGHGYLTQWLLPPSFFFFFFREMCIEVSCTAVQPLLMKQGPTQAHRANQENSVEVEGGVNLAF